MEERLLATHKTKCMKVSDRQCILQTVYKLFTSGRSTYTPAQVYASHIIITQCLPSGSLVGVVGMAGVRKGNETIQFLELIILQLVTQVIKTYRLD